MNPSLALPEYRHRIARRLFVAFCLIIATVLAVGGESLFLATRILRNQRAVANESAHSLAIDRIESVFSDLISEIHLLKVSEEPGQVDKMRSLLMELTRRLEVFRDLHRRKEGWVWKPQEEAAFGDLWQAAEELRSLAGPESAQDPRSRALLPRNIHRLASISRHANLKAEELDKLHRVELTALEQESEQLLQGIVTLYLIFTLAGCILIVAAGLVFHRRVTAPLRTLADAALGIAEGRMDQRSPIRSRDEFGEVSHAFNIMAERVETREREIADLHMGLQGKVLERTRELEQTMHSLVSTQEALARSERAALVGQIAAAVTHRIRIPLNALAINLQLLQRSIDSQAVSPEESRQLLSTAHHEVDRINRTLEEFIRYTRLPKPRIATVDFHALVREVAAFLQARAEAARVAITLKLEEYLPSIQADEDQLREVLVNLSSNAIEAMPNGGRLGYETCRVEDDQRSAVIVRVSDIGVGIPAQTLSHIFEPFYSTKPTGLGLGLAIAQRIVGEHGGTIKCLSGEGVGTTFEVILPLTPPSHPSGPEDSQADA